MLVMYCLCAADQLGEGLIMNRAGLVPGPVDAVLGSSARGAGRRSHQYRRGKGADSHALRLQLAESLAHRNMAGPEFRCDVILTQPRVGRDRSGDDPRRQGGAIRVAVVSRCGCLIL